MLQVLFINSYLINLNFYNNIFDYIFLNVYIENIIFIFLVLFVLIILFENILTCKKVKFLNFLIFYMVFLNIILYDPNIILNIYFETKNKYNIWFFTDINFFSNFFFFISSFFFSLIILGFFDELFIKENKKSEYSLILYLSFFVSNLLIISYDLIEIFLCLECISLCSYVLVGFERQNRLSALAGVRYIILGSFPAVVFILGVSLLYKNFGSFFKNNIEIIMNNIFLYEYSQKNILNWKIFTDNLVNTNNLVKTDNLFETFSLNSIYNNYFLENNFNITIYKLNYYYIISVELALLLLMINFLFKMTAAPFHVWAPSIYNDAPIASTLFLTVFLKIVLLSFFINFFLATFYSFKFFWGLIIFFVSFLTMFVGMFGAFSEKYIKKFIIYSSMGHVGFMIIGFPFFLIEDYKYIMNYLIYYFISKTRSKIFN